MIRSILTLSARPENVARVIELYRAEDILQDSLNRSRALASEISVSADGSGEMIVTALWPDLLAYQEWLDEPNRARTAPLLSALLDGAAVGAARLYEIDHSVSKLAE